MSDDATLDQEGAPGMDALNEGQEPATTIAEASPDGALQEEPGLQEPGEDERPKSKHELAMEAVAATRLKDLEEETGQVLGATGAREDELGTLVTDEVPGARKLRLVKVDGEELEVGDDELIREYQKGRTADRRLEQAADERKRNEAESARLAADRAEFERTRTGREPAKPAGSGERDSQATPIGDDEAKQLYEDLVSGDEDSAIKAIKKLTEGRQEAIPPEQITARVVQEIDWRNAQGAFAKDYSDITADPLLSQIASNTLRETLKTSKSFDQAFQEAGDRTRAWARGIGRGTAQAGGGQPPPDPGQAEKLARKERIDNPTAINARAAGKPQETVASPSAVIKEMRQARGLPT
jgi:hypothetical protein